MTDFKELREALDAGPTEGPWVADCRDVTYRGGEWQEDEFLQWELHGPRRPPGRGDFFQADARYIAAANPSVIRSLLAELDAARRDASAKQARIDALMLEHCPDEMTDEQVANWGDAQAAAKHNPAIDAMKEQQ